MKNVENFVFRLICDKGTFNAGTAARQAMRLKDAMRAGAEVRLSSPPGARFACMHVKTLVFDRKVVLTGSVNMSHNGLENSKEHLFRITVPETVEATIADFEEHWTTCQPLTMEAVEQVMGNNHQRREKRAQRSQDGPRSSPSRSQPRE